jgi:nitrate/nitrite-specific signal transduction histidine kinase
MLGRPVPVAIDVPVGRPPTTGEATASFVVAEALTNIAKHAQAQRTEVTARRGQLAARRDMRRRRRRRAAGWKPSLGGP